MFYSLHRADFVFSSRSFHAHTLELYRAVCSQGNHRAAHELIKHIDEKQLMFTIKSKCK